MGFIEENNFRDDKGRLMPGHKGLRPKGASNRLQPEIKEKITQFLSGELENLEAIYSEVQAKDKLRFLGELLSYVLPKSKEITFEKEVDESEINFSQWETEDLRAIQSLIDKYKKHE